jgi:HEAT repeat protein
MKMNRVLDCVLILVLGLGLLPGDPQIAWETDFDGALKAAKADGKPLFIAFIMDNETANDEIAKNHFHDKEIVEQSKNFHPLICSVGIHGKTSTDICPRFGVIPCASHQNIEQRARGAYIQSSQASAPQFIFVKPDGETILVRSVWAIGPAELLKKMKLALGYHDASKAGDEVKRQREEVDRLLALADDKNAVRRASALASLSTLDDPRIMEFLAKQTAETVDEPRRIEAVDAMGKRGNAKSLPVLLKLLVSGSAQMRNHATIALEKLGMMEAGPGLYAALKKEQKDNVKSNLCRALAVCDPEPPDHLKQILAMIASGSQIERCSAIRASFDVPMKGPAKELLKKALLTAAKDPTAQVRGAAYYALANRQIKEAIPIIEKAIPQEKVKDVKSLAESALSMLKGTNYDGPNADDIMKGFLVDEDLRKE